jgi:hypothetical protein
MKEELLDFINQLKADRKIESFDEAATKQAVILRLLSFLGWNPFNIEEVHPEYSVGDKLVDYSLRIGNANKVFLEVKRISEDLEKHQEQLLNYSFQEGVKLASLTNGMTWWFYLPLHEGSWEQRKFFTIDILQQESDDVVSRFIDFLSKENVTSGKAVENAEKVYRGQQKQNILQATLPKAWNKIITERDELLIELINETTEKLCGYKTDNESIAQFILKYQSQFLISRDYPSGPRLISPKKQGVPGKQELKDKIEKIFIKNDVSPKIKEIFWTIRDIIFQVGDIKEKFNKSMTSYYRNEIRNGNGVCWLVPLKREIRLHLGPPKKEYQNNQGEKLPLGWGKYPKLVIKEGELEGVNKAYWLHFIEQAYKNIG